MSPKLRYLASATLLVGVEAAAVAALQRLGRVAALDVPFDDMETWLASTDPELVTASIARVVALALACWLLASTVLYVAAQALRRDVLVAVVGTFTFPAARRILDRALVAGVLATALLSRAPGATAGPATEPTPINAEPRSGRFDATSASRVGSVRIGRAAPESDQAPASKTPPPPDTPVPTTPEAPTTPETHTTPEAPTTPIPPTTESAVTSASATYVVVNGDNLWTIAARRIAGTSRVAREVPTAEVALYWKRLVAMNRSALRSGDPDLIFPGEILRLP